MVGHVMRNWYLVYVWGILGEGTKSLNMLV